MSNRSMLLAFGVSVSLLCGLGSACSSSSSDGGSGGAAGSTSGGSAAGGSAAGGTTAAGGASAKGGSAAGGKAAQGGSVATGSGGQRPCETVQCLRAYECVKQCGGPLLSSGCCPCENGTIDRVKQCSSGGSSAGGAGAGGSAGAGSFDLSKLNSDCVNGACPTGLTPIKYYGIAGPSGPEFCSCSIPCSDASVKCPSGSSCQTIADGPGQVCVAN
ncbi:MAG: hypothetical protein QM756_18180 [Polyangiaceae bacterium]